MFKAMFASLSNMLPLHSANISIVHDIVSTCVCANATVGVQT